VATGLITSAERRHCRGIALITAGQVQHPHCASVSRIHSPLPNRSLNFFAPSGSALDVIGVPFGYSSAIRSSQYVAGFGALQSRRYTSSGTCLSQDRLVVPVEI